MSKLCVILLSLTLAGAAQAQMSTPHLAVGLPGYSTAIVLDTIASIYTVSAPRQAVYAATRAAFDTLEVPLAIASPERGILVNTAIVKMRKLGKFRLTQIMSCGTNITGQIADQWRLTMAVGAIVDSIGPRETRLRLALVGGAESMDGASKPSVACATTGQLEERVAELVKEKTSR